MQHIRTYYQEIETGEELVMIDDELVFLPVGSQVSYMGKAYKVVDVEDVIKGTNSISRSIWCKEVSAKY